MKEKELVTLRAKNLKKGSKSLYLDYMIGGIRYKDYLKMYLIPVRTKLDARQNEETLKIAQAAKAKKVLDIQSGSINLRRRSAVKDMLLYDYIMKESEDYASRGHASHARTLEKIGNWVKQFHHRVSIRGVDKKWLMDFVKYMKKEGLSDTTVHTYFSNLNTIFNRAYRAEIINENPVSRMDKTEKPQYPETEREYLTLDELKRLMATPCRDETVKRAFIFACFTGLRLSDIEGLTWENVKPTSEGGWQVEEKQMKTKKIVVVPLSDNALEQLPERGAANERVWKYLPSRPKIGRDLRKWVQDAGIGKTITFHSSRHTNATLLITFGADIYTVSSLLGHTDIATTQIYAKIVNEKKQKAVNLIPKI